MHWQEDRGFFGTENQGFVVRERNQVQFVVEGRIVVVYSSDACRGRCFLHSMISIYTVNWPHLRTCNA